MSSSCLSAAQQQRSRQVHTAHTNMKQLADATAEAIRYYDKYLESMEKVMTCLLNNSDNWEDIRTSLGPRCSTIDVIGPSGGRLAAAYNTWKVSHEVQALRIELEKLNLLTKTGRTYTKAAKAEVELLEKAAKKNEDYTSAKYEAKIAKHTGKDKDKLLRAQREHNLKMQELDRAAERDMISAGSWWSGNLVRSCDDLYTAYLQLGRRTLSCFTDPFAAPSRGASVNVSPSNHTMVSPGEHSPLQRSMRDAGGAVAAATSGGAAHYPPAGSTAGQQDTANMAVGVPLQFNSVVKP